jgi:SAM-dependent methyltransferase
VTQDYVLADTESELGRLRRQSEIWEPAARTLLTRLGPGGGRRALDVACGPLGWLRVLDEAGWSVVGTDLMPDLLEAARTPAPAAELVQDDLFATRLEPASFDLVHARFVLAPLGRWEEQLAIYRRLLRPGGMLVLEEPDSGSWHFNPRAPGAERVIELVLDAFRAAGSEFDAGRALRSLLEGIGLKPQVAAHVVALPPGEPYLRVPLQFAHSLRARLDPAVAGPLIAEAEDELADPARWGTSFTVIQAWATV